jgi:ArsR family metal-binding transcriptional regulator
VGGPMTVADRYQARKVIESLTRKYGIKRKVRTADVREEFEKGRFFSGTAKVPKTALARSLSISEAIERQARIESILQKLPLKECGACGSPDCRAFAEDVVAGRVPLGDCVFIQRQQLRKEPRGEGSGDSERAGDGDCCG